MKTFEYCLFPEADYRGEYVRREGHIIFKVGTVADLVIDTGMLLWSNYDKVIRYLTEFNRMLLKGDQT